MLRALTYRIASGVITLFLASLAIFSLMRLAPGDPASIVAGADATPDQIAAVREQFGMNHPQIVQYFDWIGGLFTGNLGPSFQSGQPVGELIARSAGSTIQLTTAAATCLLVLGLLFGLLMTNRRSGRLRNIADWLSTVALAMPVYVSAIIFILVFAVELRLVPPGGEESIFQDPAAAISYLILPSIAMAIPGSAVLGRLLATEIRTTRQLEFVMTARAKGLMPGAVDRRHVLPGSLTSFIVQFGINLGEMLGGAIVAEALFTRHGLGQLLIDSVNQRDYPTAQTLLMIAITIAILVQFITESYLIWADPRVRASKG